MAAAVEPQAMDTATISPLSQQSLVEASAQTFNASLDSAETAMRNAITQQNKNAIDAYAEAYSDKLTLGLFTLIKSARYQVTIATAKQYYAASHVRSMDFVYLNLTAQQSSASVSAASSAAAATPIDYSYANTFAEMISERMDLIAFVFKNLPSLDPARAQFGALLTKITSNQGHTFSIQEPTQSQMAAASSTITYEAPQEDVGANEPQRTSSGGRTTDDSGSGKRARTKRTTSDAERAASSAVKPTGTSISDRLASLGLETTNVDCDTCGGHNKPAVVITTSGDSTPPPPSSPLEANSDNDDEKVALLPRQEAQNPHTFSIIEADVSQDDEGVFVGSWTAETD